MHTCSCGNPIPQRRHQCDDCNADKIVEYNNRFAQRREAAKQAGTWTGRYVVCPSCGCPSVRTANYHRPCPRCGTAMRLREQRVANTYTQGGLHGV